jgi:hypothetical protein
MYAHQPLLSQRSLLRHFIAVSLYDQKHGYFCKGDTGRKIGRVNCNCNHNVAMISGLIGSYIR